MMEKVSETLKNRHVWLILNVIMLAVLYLIGSFLFTTASLAAAIRPAAHGNPHISRIQEIKHGVKPGNIVNRSFLMGNRAMDRDSFAYIIGKDGYDWLDGLAKLQDGDLILTGDTNDGELPLALRFSPDGKIVWQKDYQFGDADGWIHRIIIPPHTDLIVALGVIDSSEGENGQDAFICKIDTATGNMTKYKSFDAGNSHNWFSDGDNCPDGGFVTIGTGYDGSIAGMDVIKLDSDFQKEWEKSFGFGSNNRNVGVSIIEDNGYYYLVGYTLNYYSDNGTEQVGDADITIMKIDSSGNVIWSKVLGGDQDDGGYQDNDYLYDLESKIIKTQDGNYAFLAETESFGENGALVLIKFDPDGNILASKLIDSPEVEGGVGDHNALSQTPDGNFVLGFWSGVQGIIMETDPGLTHIVWQKATEGAGNSTSIYSILPDSSGVFGIGDGGLTDEDALIVKTNQGGDVSSTCITMEDAQITISDITIPVQSLSCNQGTVNAQEVTGRTTTVEDAGLSKICPTPGDANGDGSINVQDVVCIINVILDTGTAPGSPDCNDDGNVNVLDVICVINKILGG